MNINIFFLFTSPFSETLKSQSKPIQMKISKESTVPIRKKKLYELSVTEPMKIKGKSTGKIPVKLWTEFPDSYCLIVTNLRFGLVSTAGVVDSDYRGEISVICYNPAEDDVEVSGVIGHFVLLRCVLPEIEVCELRESERGESGFGSTGVLQ